ncbi:5-oxoprolinase subunit PxpB [Leuconostoc mesenteroides]|uniref:5-oxoprolinase subunit PxpB n=1 Tax=Leuconostoc mesenteroides TaxID=1245 RepID=UPI0011428FA3|nr:5-oxoprolinase subunit PxpB [Leuconostoc mesenteroides]GEA91875.1 allophanate hydrolase [Leuconostoc mesenteroides subsp. mesenteroides]
MNSKVIFSGDTSINVVFENVVSEKISNQVLSIAKLVERQHINGLVDIIPAYREVTFVFDPLVLDIASFKHFLEKQLNKMDGEIVDKNGRHYDIPVLYNDEVGLDLLEVAKYHGLSLEEVIHLHTAQAYRIYMLGFLPGFAYLGGLDAKLHTPRKNTPRLRIPAGSIAIGGEQTGYYPVDSPGGWQIIGQTPLVMFDSNRPEIKLHAGDRMKFYAIDNLEFQKLKGTHFDDFVSKEKTL